MHRTWGFKQANKTIWHVLTNNIYFKRNNPCLKKTFTWSDPPFPPILFSFTIRWNKLSILEWHRYLRKAHIPHNYSCYWPQVHQRESSLGYLAEALRSVLSVSLASGGLHHRQSCVVYLCLNPKSNHSKARCLATQQPRKQPLWCPASADKLLKPQAGCLMNETLLIQKGARFLLVVFSEREQSKGKGLDGLFHNWAQI